MLNRWIEGGLLDVLGREGVGCIAFSPLAQGLLTGRYLTGIPAGSRASRTAWISPDKLSDANLAHIRKLSELASARGQTMAQMAISWVLRDPRMTSALIGASSVGQLEENLKAVDGPPFTADELRTIDSVAASGDR
jgi:L-glyceraldehyde 3-phosphate reductase